MPFDASRRVENNEEAINLSFFIFLICSPTIVERYTRTGTVEVYPAHNVSATDAIVTELSNAKSEILVQAYPLSVPIVKALIDAKKRGIKIEVVLDKSQGRDKYYPPNFVANAGIVTFIDDKHAIDPNKIIIVDRNILITGSCNFTNGDELLIIKGHKPLLDLYIQDFKGHEEHSKRYLRIVQGNNQ